MAHVDAAYDGDHYCALTIAAPLREEGKNQYYQIVGFTYPGNVRDWIGEIAQLCRKYRTGAVYVETNPDKGFTAGLLKGKGLRVKDYTERMNKHLKISTQLYNVWPYLEWDPDTDGEYMLQVTDYREAFSNRGSRARAMYEW
jgi:hypothetical protein